MKAFWLLVALLAVGASLYLLLGHQETRGSPQESTLVSSTAVAPYSEPPLPAVPPVARPEATQSAQYSIPTPVAAPTPPSAPVAAADPAPAQTAPSAPTATEPPVQESGAPAEVSKPSEPAEAAELPKPPAPTKPAEAAPPAQSMPTPPAGISPQAPKASPDSAPAAGPKPDAAPPASNPDGPKLVARDDGSLLVDDRFVLRGKGTKEKPYKVTWDQLLSAQEDYVPRDGRKKMPSRITMLDGKYVELTGFVAFPVMADSDDECLSMMNQWDGCCIGVPPTPYDAVEVRLDSPAKGNARLTTYGTIKGKLKISPHLVGGWLVGLYVMDSGALKPQAFGGFAP